MNEGMNTIVYPVKDIEKGKELFSTLLGVEPSVDLPHYVQYEVGEMKIGLNPNGHAMGATGALCFWDVADIEDAIEELTAAGAHLSQAPRDVGGKLVGSVKDADGNFIGLIQAP
jgi:predicted enzyme related to lactoylglutathione lyase